MNHPFRSGLNAIVVLVFSLAGGATESLAADVSPELASATIESITVLGALQASREVKAALAERIN